MNRNKKNLILGLVLVLLLLVVGVTYAFFTYESGTKSDIVTGQIYMNYEETSTISLTGMFPETKAQALARQDENGVFEFTITGRNTSKYPVYYEIDLLEGGVITGKTEQSTKILPEHVRIYLERDGEPLVDGMTYKDWNNRRIYVDTVPEGTTSNIEHKYTLRMWIDENVTISDTDPNADYTTTEWNDDAYTSLKVRVVGDFEYKEVATDASCFTYRVFSTDPNTVTFDNPIITLDTSDEKVNTCKDFLLNDYFYGNDYSDAQDGYQSFCEGTGTVEWKTLKNTILYDWFTDEQIQSLSVAQVTHENRYYELNTSEDGISACKEYMLNDFDPGVDYSDAQDGYQSFCEGTGTMTIDYTSSIYDRTEIHYYLIEKNVLVQIDVVNKGIEIQEYKKDCGSDVIIPKYIESLPVVRIAKGNYEVGYSSFAEKNITSVTLPNTLQYIGEYAFADNELESIIIPDSVSTIKGQAFWYNKLTNVEVGKNVTFIDQNAFGQNPLVDVVVKNNPILGLYSFYGNNYLNDIINYQTFQYDGTCTELNQYSNVFNGVMPQQIITSDTNSCTYTGPVIPQ